MKKLVVGVLAVVVITLGLVGCQGKSSPSGAESQGNKVSIQFMHQQVEQERQDVVQEIINRFEAQNPDITVEQIPVNEDDFDSKIVALGSSGQIPAVIEYSQDQAKTSVVNEFTNVQAVNDVIMEKGEDQFYQGALDVIKTEDGQNYVGVPLFGWVQGIWVNSAMLAEKNMEVPTNWEEVMEVAKAFHDPANKRYGISIPTADVAFTEQVFSQFALSNGANVFDRTGAITVNSNEMKEAMAYYRELSTYPMPGSTEVADVKDAFIGKNTPMVIYSTYILNAVKEAGFIQDLSLVLPNNKEEAAYGCIIVLGVAQGMKENETQAAKKFITFLLEEENNIEWLHMAPGGVQPVLTAVNGSEAYEANDAIKEFAHLSEGIGKAFENLQLFGIVDGKNFMTMGDITNTGTISKMINNVVVQKADIEKELDTAQSKIQELVQ